MPRTLNVPSFDFTGASFYPQILERLIVELRENCPEITNEDRGEVAIQILSAFAFVGHLNNVLVDLVAHESLMVTTQLRDSLVAHMKLIGFEVEGDIPSTTDLVVTLKKGAYTATTEILGALATFSTLRRSASDQIVFEVQDAYEITRTDQLTKVWIFDASGPTFVDRTTEANTDSSTFRVLPPTPAAGDILYVGHDTVMTDRLKALKVSTPMSGVFGVWEYSDDELEDDSPDTVTDLGATLRVVVDELLDTDGSIDHSDLEVRVTLNSTGAFEDAIVANDGNNYVEIDFLGQALPSEEARDYSVGTNWHRVPGLDDDTNSGSTTLQIAGNIDFVLPQDVTRDWRPIAVNGVTAFWLRFRVISVSTPVAAIIDRLKWAERDNYVIVSAIQGLTTQDEVLGSSDGTASQAFRLGSENVIDGTVVVSVDSQTWTEVTDFLSSVSVDQHYIVELDSDGIATVTFGDGVSGAIPASGTGNVTVTYRSSAHLDGNVGSDTIRVNRSGNSNVRAVTNPRPASGWVERRGITATDRERLKVEGPASIRTLDRAVTSADVEYLTVQFKNAAGQRPFVRSHAIEEGFGVKTVKIVTVGPAGALTDSDDRDELELYFNGNPSTGESGVMVSNQRVFARDYAARPIDVELTVITSATQEEVENAILALLSPVAVKDDGITFRWQFGQAVTTSAIIASIVRLDEDADVNLISPATNEPLDDDELPTIGTLTVTVTSS